jgi:hypothetical protein
MCTSAPYKEWWGGSPLYHSIEGVGESSHPLKPTSDVRCWNDPHPPPASMDGMNRPTHALHGPRRWEWDHPTSCSIYWWRAWVVTHPFIMLIGVGSPPIKKEGGVVPLPPPPVGKKVWVVTHPCMPLVGMGMLRPMPSASEWMGQWGNPNPFNGYWGWPTYARR